ncbi:DUF2987 domain-containing protein [Aestuariibacter salexigens]|uniref:DUF2987 domain-containing protein n=1 Tax=Aestuariibacter salexigens TaxID=226010 RepID=UPI0004079C38|nr:DUF2987 domain-containing protein [Aestuariibacter salexigens]
MKSVFLLLILFTANVLSAPLEIDYKGFYSHLRKLNTEDLTALQFSFGFKRVGESRLCSLNEVKVLTQKQTLDIEISTEQRFNLPFEEALKLADALVVVDTQEPENTCDMSVQLETKPSYLKAQYSQSELDFLLQQYTLFFDDMGGMFSFLMPGVSGLVFHFADSETQLAGLPFKLSEGKLQVPESDLSELEGVLLPAIPTRITALIQD